jgi:4-hydroxy-3-polyprenylbenzoate decarboxylase
MDSSASIQSNRWVVGVSGSSGMPYALRIIQFLAEQGNDVSVVFSESALRVLAEEQDLKTSQSGLSTKKLFGRDIPGVSFFNPKDIGAWFASGSAPAAGMVIVPCSMATLGIIANGCGNNLIHRAADVCLKEYRRLVIVPRETPLSQIHLENMLKLSRMGARIVPAMPGFYHQPASIQDLVDMMVMKILDSMGVPNNLVKRWGGEAEPPGALIPIKGGVA